MKFVQEIISKEDSVLGEIKIDFLHITLNPPNTVLSEIVTSFLSSKIISKLFTSNSFPSIFTNITILFNKIII